MKTNKGFTIVELTLAIGFVSLLLLAVVFTTIFIGRQYQRGTTYKAVNQTGRDIVREFTRDVRQARDGRVLFVKDVPDAGTDSNAYSFRVCMGTVSYVGATANATLRYGDTSTGVSVPAGQADIPRIVNGSTSIPARLVRITDVDYSFCLPNTSASPGGNKYLRQNINAVADRDTYNNFLLDDTIKLAPHQFEFEEFADRKDSTVYRFRMLLSTHEESLTERMVDDSGRCLPPDSNSNFDGCAVSEFATMIRTGY